jgi:hypothetical protein
MAEDVVQGIRRDGILNIDHLLPLRLAVVKFTGVES